MASVPLVWILTLGAAIFSVGVYGVLVRRRLIGLLICAMLMFNAVVLTLVAFARAGAAPLDVTGEIFALVVCVLATATVALGLALVKALRQMNETATAVPFARQRYDVDADR